MSRLLEIETVPEGLEEDWTPIPLDKLSKDLKNSGSLLSHQQARYLVDTYYQLQHFRIASGNQARTKEKEEPTEFIVWLHKQTKTLEENIKGTLFRYSQAQTAGRWAMSICGIGPVISAGLQAHWQPEENHAVSNLWSFAGLHPNIEWKSGEKRPYNAKLKSLCAFKIGESFIKQQNKPSSFYGRFYVERKALEKQRNEDGLNEELCLTLLTQKKWDKSTEAYKHLKNGLLPPAQIHARARRYAVKLFLSHYAQVAYYAKFNKPIADPYVFSHLKHKDRIAVPNWPF